MKPDAGRIPDIPDFEELPPEVRTSLASRGYDAAWYGSAVDKLRLTLLNLYVKLMSLSLWRFVAREVDSELGSLQFLCADLPGLLAALRRLRFTRPDPEADYWDAREKRLSGALHLKHFHGWPEAKLQAHIDRTGFTLRWWWWLLPPVALLVMLFHAAEPRSYQDVVRIRRMLLEQGADSRILLSRADRA